MYVSCVVGCHVFVGCRVVRCLCMCHVLWGVMCLWGVVLWGVCVFFMCCEVSVYVSCVVGCL